MSETVYSRKQIEDWQTKLAELAEKPRTRFTKKQAVEALIEQIEQALTAHAYDQVAESLKDWGLDISPGSLKQYVNAYRRSHNPQTAAATRKRSSAKKKKQGSTRKSQSAAAMATADPLNPKPGKATAAKSKPKRFVEMDEDL